MRVGILGSGLMGGQLGTLFARGGHEVVFSYSRSRKKLERLARDAGVTARVGTPREAAQDADVLLLAVHWSRVDDVLHQAGDMSGRVIVSCSLPMNEDDSDLVIAHTSSGAESLREKQPEPPLSPRSAVCQARCYSASMMPERDVPDPTSFTAGTTMRRRSSPRS